MTATFDNTLPTELDQMRFMVGDVDVAAALEQDETYASALALHGFKLGTAAIAEALAARYAQRPDSISSEDGSLSWRERVKTWLALATRLRAEEAAGIAGGAIFRIGTRGEAIESEYVRSAEGGNWFTD